MVKILLFIKHRLTFLWVLIEHVNTLLFVVLHKRKVLPQLQKAMNEFSENYTVRLLTEKDTALVATLINNQNPERLRYFQPHGFDEKSIRKALRNRALLTMGVFRGDELVGYFFLRCFWNKKCFVGRLVDEKHEGKGIGVLMNKIMYNTAWRSRFRCLSTISKNNKAVMDSHANNPYLKVIEELPDNYLFVEFLPPENLSANEN